MIDVRHDCGARNALERDVFANLEATSLCSRADDEATPTPTR